MCDARVFELNSDVIINKTTNLDKVFGIYEVKNVEKFGTLFLGRKCAPLESLNSILML